MRATSLKLVPVADPAAAAKQEVDLGVAFGKGVIDEYYDPNRQSAQIADTRLQTVLGQYDAAQAAAALQSRGIDPGILTPLHLVPHPLSSPIQAASNAFLSFFLPYILITMILTGGFSAALDSSAGERERKTLESLLLTPAPRSRVLLGKIAAVTTISLVAAVAAIGSMFLALTQISLPGPSGTTHFSLSPVAVPVMVWVALLIAVSFSAVSLALGTLAKTFRQGQAYVTPLYFVTIFPASIILFIPDFNPSLAYYLIPILNAVLVLRDAIVHNAVEWPSLAVTSVSLLATGALSWFVALKLFTREALLTRS
jgi:sodium transport system permease protein